MGVGACFRPAKEAVQDRAEGERSPPSATEAKRQQGAGKVPDAEPANAKLPSIETITELLNKVDPKDKPEAERLAKEEREKLLAYTGSKTWVEAVKKLMVPIRKAGDLVEKAAKDPKTQALSGLIAAGSDMPYVGAVCGLITVVLDQVIQTTGNWAACISFLKKYRDLVAQYQVLEDQPLCEEGAMQSCKDKLAEGAVLCCKILDDQGRMERFFTARVQSGALEKFDKETVNAWAVMTGTIATEVLRRTTPPPQAPEFETQYTTSSIHDTAHTILGELTELPDQAHGLLLFGMGGIGKTTLAYALYNLLRERVEDARFAWVEFGSANVGKSDHLKLLQKEIYAQLFSTSKRPVMDGPTNLNHGRKQLFDRLVSERPKIVLFIDDAWERDLVEVLPEMLLRVAAPGSLCFVTSRQDGVKLNGMRVYQVEELGRAEALQLFCQNAGICLTENESWQHSNDWHASEQCPRLTDPHWLKGSPAGWAQRIFQATAQCSGLPLALEVMGKHLAAILQKDSDTFLTTSQIKDLPAQKQLQSEWTKALSKLKTAQDQDSQKQLFKILQISVDALSSSDREAFLDFACNPAGNHGELLEEIWGAQGWQLDLTVLVRRSLLKRQEDKQLVMHDQLRDLGRLIEITTNHTSNGKPRRIWDFDKHIKRGISMDNLDELLLCHRRSFNEWVGTAVESIPPKLPRIGFLSWVYHKGDSLCGLPASLVGLKISRALSLKRLDVQAFSSLRCLDIGGALRLEYVETKWPRSLEYISLSNCNPLPERLEGLDGLDNLKVLDLSGCKGLRCLPSSIFKLSSLCALRLEGCTNINMLPDNIGGSNSLQEIDLYGCSSLVTLPFGLGTLSSLQELKLQMCPSLAALPSDLSTLSTLQRLFLGQCSILEGLLSSLSSQSCLQLLSIDGCSSLPSAIGGFSTLRSLMLGRCKGMHQLPKEISNLVSLQALHLLCCQDLHELPVEIFALSNLKSLEASLCYNLKEVPCAISRLACLEELAISDCLLKDISDDISELANLQSLDLDTCDCVESLPDTISKLSNLRKLNLSGCTKLKRLPNNIGELISLQSLTLRHCYSLESLPESIGRLSKLHRLDLYKCNKLNELPPGMGNAAACNHLP